MPDLIRYTATGRYFKVYLDGSYISQHTTEREAAEKCANLAFQYPESAIFYTHDYEVAVGLTDAGLTVQKDYGQSEDVAPNITTTPAPIFYQTNADTYNMAQHWFDDGVSTVVSSMSGVLPNGLLYNGNTHTLSYDGVEPATTAQHTLTAQDAVGSDTSSSFDVVIVGTPQITGTPAPSFTEGSSGTYDLSQFVSFGVASQYEPSATYSISGSLGAGLSLDTNTGILSYDGVGAASSNSHTFTVTASTGSAVSDSFSVPVTAVASGDAYLAFSDLISGPDTGLGDGLGSGAIVTIWGFNLGSSQGASTITFTDSTSTERSAAHVYYWKNADGTLPSGPANLYESHGMQEVCFSIPASATGSGTIHLTVGGQDTNTLPFLVRSGRIFHVKSTGNDSNDGSFNSPFLTIGKADVNTFGQMGDTIYVHDVTTGSTATETAVYNNNDNLQRTLINQYGYVAYPNNQPEVIGDTGFHFYRAYGVVISKFSVFGAWCDSVGENCGALSGKTQRGAFGITTPTDGRVIANEVTDYPGRCSNSQAGAISGGRDDGDNCKIYGNHVHDYSCPEASKLHHSTYMTIRDGSTWQAWEWGWNYLIDCHAKNGIHNFDEGSCGNVTTPLHIHDNVIVNQAGAGITIEGSCGWSTTTYIYNNVLINVGLASDINCTFNCGQNGGAISLSIDGDVYVYNNTIMIWDAEDLPDAGTSSAAINLARGEQGSTFFVDNNIFYNDQEKDLIGYFLGSEDLLDNFVSTYNNVWYYPGITSNDPPTWDANAIYTDPLLNRVGSQINIGVGSPAINAGNGSALLRDIYGQVRAPNKTIGSIES